MRYQVSSSPDSEHEAWSLRDRRTPHCGHAAPRHGPVGVRTGRLLSKAWIGNRLPADLDVPNEFLSNTILTFEPPRAAETFAGPERDPPRSLIDTSCWRAGRLGNQLRDLMRRPPRVILELSRLLYT
jgi:hypothetical protein